MHFIDIFSIQDYLIFLSIKLIFGLGSANVGEIQEFQSEVETVRTEVANLHVDVEQQTSKVNIYIYFEEKIF